MKGTEFEKTLPKVSGHEREAAILKAAQDGHIVTPEWTWVELPPQNGRRARVLVMRFPVMIGEAVDDGLIVSVTPSTAQAIADLTWRVEVDDLVAEERCFLPTTRVLDAMWEHAKRVGTAINPHTQPPGNATAKMVLESDLVKGDLEKIRRLHADTYFHPNGGKHYPLTNVTLNRFKGVLHTLANYGWYLTGDSGAHVSASGYRMWQPLGTAHAGVGKPADDVGFTDYSQMFVLMFRVMQIMEPESFRSSDASVWTTCYFDDIATCEETASLVSSEGPLRTLKLWGTQVDASRADTEPPTEVFSPVSGFDEKAAIPSPPKVPAMKLKQSEDDRRLWRIMYRASIDVELARYGERGEAVEAWQRYAQLAADGIFGPLTEKRTMEKQKQLGVPVTGRVDQATLDAATAEINRMNPLPGESDDLGTQDSQLFPVYQTIAARNYTKANRKTGDIFWLVIHTMEAAEKPTTAEAVAQWFAGANAPQASAHFCVDSNSIVKCVPVSDVAWAAPGANKYGIHFELAGYAKQSSLEWDDDYSRSLLKQAANIVGWHAARYDIPLKKLTVDELKEARTLYQAGKAVPRKLQGICGHVDTSKAWGLSSHYDPGPNFPWDKFLDEVRRYANKYRVKS